MNKNNMGRHLRVKHPKTFRKAQHYLKTENVSGCWAKKYCHKVGEGKYQCDLCDAVLSLPRGLFGNMQRHIRNKHPYVYKKEINPLEENPDDEDNGTKKNLLNTSSSLVKGCWAKKYCHKVGEGKYQCNVCDGILSLAKGLFGNMTRHIRSKHPEVYEKEMNNKEDKAAEDSVKDSDELLSTFIKRVREKNKTKSDKENSIDVTSESNVAPSPANADQFLNESDPNFETIVKYLVTKKVTCRKRAKSCFWNFFNVLEEDRVYSCLACNRQITVFAHNFGNLKRHIKNKHKLQYELMMKYIAEGDADRASPVSFDKHYFDSEGDNLFKCKECGVQITCKDEDQQVLFEHIKDSHPDQILVYHEESAENVSEQVFECVTLPLED